MTAAIIAYSLFGHTLRVAQELALQLGAPLSTIHAPDMKPGPLAMLRFGFAALTGQQTRVALLGPGAAGHDLTILAAPVWAGHVAVPMRSWLKQHPPLPGRIALVLTGGAAERPTGVFAEFARLSGALPCATLYVGQAMIAAGQDKAAVAALCDKLTVQSPLEA